jgi:plasmid replication initiation protein
MAALKTPLLPDRHPQKDFFIADIFDNLPVKDDMASMGHPMFTLSKNKDLRVIQYKSEHVHISISPSFEHGLPTIFDKDVLLYCCSLLMAEVNKGIIPPKTLRISINDLLKTTNRLTGGESYDRIENALKRLHGVSITTNIKTNGVEQLEAFHLLESFRSIRSSFVKDRRVALEITVSDWLYNSVLGKEVLTISRDYFRLGKAIERRLYEIARKHCGKQDEWKISLEMLYSKVGSTAPLRKFRFFIREIVETNHLPDYTIALTDDDMVVFGNRNEGKEQDKAGGKQGVLALDTMPRLSPAAIEIGREITKKARTGWDFYFLQQEFTVSLLKGFRPEKVDGAFINFIKKKMAKRA